MKREITQFSYFENLKLENCPFSKWQFAPFQYCNKIQKPADLNQWSPNKTIKSIFWPYTCHQFLFTKLFPLHHYCEPSICVIFYLRSWEQITKQVVQLLEMHFESICKKNTCLQNQRLYLNILDIFGTHTILGLQYSKQNHLSQGLNPHQPSISIS